MTIALARYPDTDRRGCPERRFQFFLHDCIDETPRPPPNDLHPVASLLAGLPALVATGGCPVCCTIGLAETIRQRYGAKGRLL
jgi:hypothetical protein